MYVNVVYNVSLVAVGEDGVSMLDHNQHQRGNTGLNNVLRSGADSEGLKLGWIAILLLFRK